MKFNRVIPVVGVSLAVLSCHTISEELPESQSQSPTRPAPIIVVPVPVPSATPFPESVPSPTPRPGSTPNPNPTPGAQGCSLPAGTGSGANCPLQRASFADDVERAIDNVIRDNPSLFDMRDNRCPAGCPRILNPDAYWTAVTNEMRRMGYCAVNDGEELAVKNTNSWNDQYDIISGDGYPRRAPGSYRSTCYPAWF